MISQNANPRPPTRRRESVLRSYLALALKTGCVDKSTISESTIRVEDDSKLRKFKRFHHERFVYKFNIGF